MRLSLQPATQAHNYPITVQGSWTALHADVLSSYSWSSQICGRKRWRLLAPQHTHLLLDTFGRCTTLPSCLLQLRACHAMVHAGARWLFLTWPLVAEALPRPGKCRQGQLKGCCTI